MALVLVTVDTLYPSPDRNDFCRGDIAEPRVDKLASNCNNLNTDNEAQKCHAQDLTPIFSYDESGCRVFDSCSTCHEDYEKEREKHNRFSFIVITIIGAIAIIGGTLYTITFMGSGFVAAGVLLVAWSTLRYFGDLNKPLRILLLLVELLLVLWVAKKYVAK